MSSALIPAPMVFHAVMTIGMWLRIAKDGTSFYEVNRNFALTPVRDSFHYHLRGS
jgi:hypothetical protein